jgi:hypothetical protein
MPPRRPLSVLAAAVACLAPPPAGAQAGAATEVFRRFSDRVVKVQVVESGSAAKASIGSGFFVGADGQVVTNYHVVSELIHSPGRYRAELVDASGATAPLRILGVDVVHDLAVVGSALRPRAYFDVAPAGAAQGDRLYSLGHPEDLGLSIVEGTYNGHLRHTLYPRLHFTGSINHGMSGGPTIAGDGRVVGINVSTAGNQLSFLVPVERAAALLARVRAPGGAPPARTLADVGRQLTEYQERYLRDVFTGATERVTLGPFRLVTQPAPFFRCWADATRRPQQPYEQVQHRCSTDDYVFVAGDQSSGVVSLKHELVSTRTLNPLRFYALYGGVFAKDETPGGEEEHVTSWRCGTRNVRRAGMRLRAVLCVRRYRKLGALYDGVLRVAALGRPNVGLVSTLTMTGVTYENVERVSRRYLERIEWK